jgi:hypothetical protein
MSTGTETVRVRIAGWSGFRQAARKRKRLKIENRKTKTAGKERKTNALIRLLT